MSVGVLRAWKLCGLPYCHTTHREWSLISGQKSQTDRTTLQLGLWTLFMETHRGIFHEATINMRLRSRLFTRGYAEVRRHLTVPWTYYRSTTAWESRRTREIYGHPSRVFRLSCQSRCGSAVHPKMALQVLTLKHRVRLTSMTTSSHSFCYSMTNVSNTPHHSHPPDKILYANTFYYCTQYGVR